MRETVPAQRAPSWRASRSRRRARPRPRLQAPSTAAQRVNRRRGVRTRDDPGSRRGTPTRWSSTWLRPSMSPVSVRGSMRKAAAAGLRGRPRLAVWVPAALDPGAKAHVSSPATRRTWLRPAMARCSLRSGSGRRRPGRAAGEPGAPSCSPRSRRSLPAQVGAVGSARDIAARISADDEAGADHVGVAPSTAEDPAGLGGPRGPAPCSGGRLMITADEYREATARFATGAATDCPPST